MGDIEDIHFTAEDGTVLRGLLFLASPKTPAPTIIMSHGFSLTQDMGLQLFADVFTEAGLNVLIYDHRNLGASAGTPRQHIDPWQQVRDTQRAITFVSQQSWCDNNKIGLWGFSYSAGHAIVLSATDRRVKCLVAMSPTISAIESVRHNYPNDVIAGMQELFQQEQVEIFNGSKHVTIPVVSNERGIACVLPGREAYQWCITNSVQKNASENTLWENAVTLTSLEYLTGYEPGYFAQYVSPTPILFVVPDNDSLALTGMAISAYEQASEPKKLIMLRGGHFCGFDTQFEKASITACEWLSRHLLST